MVTHWGDDGERGVVRSRAPREKVEEWKRRYLQLRPSVSSDAEAYSIIASEDPHREWDLRTVKSHVQKSLPLGLVSTIRTLADVVSDLEARRPLWQVLAEQERQAPIAEVAPRLGEVVRQFIRENPDPAQGLRALANLLSGGFPLDDRRL
jgi:hypothetical protein